MALDRPGAPRHRGRRTASPVTIRHADGTVEEQPAYTAKQLDRIDAKAARQPRTWDEINSRAGGGTDGTFVRR